MQAGNYEPRTADRLRSREANVRAPFARELSAGMQFDSIAPRDVGANAPAMAAVQNASKAIGVFRPPSFVIRHSSFVNSSIRHAEA